MDMPTGKREALTAADWTEAALDALAHGGLPAVAVEPLAKALGATKGSFYWHFADRQALVAATLELWERRDTELVIAAVDETQDVETQLRNLLRLAFASVRDGSVGGAGTVELALQASATHPLVAPTLDRVTKRRLAFLTRLYTQLGLSRAQARDRGLLAYTAFLGHAQIAHATPELLPQGRALRRPRGPGRRGPGRPRRQPPSEVLTGRGAVPARLIRHAVPMRVWRRTHLGSEADRATFRTLHTASLASPALREGLTRASAERAVRHLRDLLGTPALAVTDTAGCLAWDGEGGHHEGQVSALVATTVEKGRTQSFGRGELPCEVPGCAVRTAVVSPLVVDERIVGTLAAFAPYPTAGLALAADETAQWVSGQLELAELDASRTLLMEAEVRALRAQISPHFIYNSLNAIASFVRTDPDRARSLLQEFADFTRYSFRKHGDFTTLAEELRSIERYLLLEQARFGDRLSVKLSVAPEVLPVAVPFLCIQPLVENAVRHGLEAAEGSGTITIQAHDRGQECVIEVEDDGAGEDPEKVRRALAGDVSIDSIGLGNVDARLRTTYGDEYGLVVETAPGAGTKVTVRVPKFAPGVTA